MTTNHLERLDPALIRPGRADVRVNFNAADEEQARLMYLRFFPGDSEGAEKFALTHGDGTRVAADLQQDLMIWRFQNRRNND